MPAADPKDDNRQEPADERWMRQAIALAERAIGLASPNPTVGCVLVQGGRLIAQGAHLYDQLDHAEIVALKQAGDQARGATAYVTLEPCSHTGRTGPCADALIHAGVTRVVVATDDPNPGVNGLGIARLRKAGIEVTTGVLTAQARSLNDGFACHIRTQLPFVTLKAGLSLDGRIAPASQLGTLTTAYLTSPPSLAMVQRMRHASDALLTGIGTVLADDPLLTDRSGLARRRPLLRVVLDSTLRLPLASRLVASARNDLLVYTADACNERAEDLRHSGVLVEEASLVPVPNSSAGSPAPNQLDIAAILASLGQRGALNLLVEAGSHLNGMLLREELVDKLSLFYAPIFLGDHGIPLIAGQQALHPKLQHTMLARSGNDFCFEGYLRDPWLKHDHSRRRKSLG